MSVDSPRPVRVLVVDDDPMVGRSLGRMLRTSGCYFECFPNASSALIRLLNTSFDVVLCDLVMPGVDGLKFIEYAKEQGSTTPIVLMSGRARPRDIVDAYRLGAVDCLLKPFDEHELEAAISRALFHMFRDEPMSQEAVSAPAPAPAPPPPPPSPTGDVLVTRIVAFASEAELTLPIPPAVLSRLLELDKSETATEDEVIAVLDSSAVLAAELLQAGRRADISRASAPPRNLNEALLRLGVTRALRHAISFAHRASADALLVNHPDRVSELWVHHLVSARAAEHLAKALYPELAPGLHGLALFMEFGEFLVLRGILALAPELMLPGADPAPVRAIVGRAHGEVGRVLLRRLNAQRAYGEVAVAHTQPVEAKMPLSASARTLVLLRAARHVATRVGPSALYSAPHVVTSEELKALPGLDAALLHSVAHGALAEVKATLGLTGAAT
jgi:CheY-like chemotaxis protein